MVVAYVILVLYVLSMVAITIYSKNRTRSVNDFLMAGKKGLNGWMSAFAYGTTYFSAVIFIGYAGKFGQSYQLAATWIGIGNAFIGSLLAWKVLAKRTKVMTHRLDTKTMPEFFEKRYESTKLKIFSAILIFVFLIPYSVSVYNGLSNLFEMVFGIPGWAIMLILAGITALYLFFGGYFATALSDFVQGIIMLIGVVLMVLFFLKSEYVNWDISTLRWFTFSSEKTGLFGDTVSLISLIFLTSFGVWALPQTIHKYHTVRDDKAINQGMIVSTVFALIIGFGAYFTGGLSQLDGFSQSLTNVGSDDVIPTMLKLLGQPWLLGIIAVLILSASMSTLSSVSLSSASVVAIDLYKGKINKNASDKKVNTIMRVLCLIFVAISVILAILNDIYHISAIAYLMGLSWGVLAGCFLGPYVLGLVWKRTTRTATWVSIITSLVMTVVLIIVFGYAKLDFNGPFELAIQNGINSSPLIGSICMCLSIILTFIVSLCTKAPSKETIQKAFENKE
ncbi:MAG: sodium:solute symporter family protein [Clostridiales bacterium]|nr:sodium:solute symporter family protein [Clostridiales bacterium]